MIQSANHTSVCASERRRSNGFAAVTAREAILSLSPTCIWPGCTCPASHCDIDHMHPRHQGGPTTMSNGAPLCSFHNRWRFRHSYAVTRDTDGDWHVWRTDGTDIAGRPPP